MPAGNKTCIDLLREQSCANDLFIICIRGFQIMNIRVTASVLFFCFVSIGIRSQEADGVMPSEWRKLDVSGFVKAFDGALSLNPNLSELVLQDLANHAWDLASLPEVRNGDPQQFMVLVARLLWPLKKYYSEENKNWLIATLKNNFQADSTPVTAGAFEKVSINWDLSRRAGVQKSDLSSWVESWINSNDWESLPPNHVATLIGFLDDDLVGSKFYSVRWTGILKPNKTGNYKFSTAARGQSVRLWLGEELLIESIQGIRGLPKHSKVSQAKILEVGQSYPLRLEFVYDIDQVYKADPTEPAIKGQFSGRSHCVLYWEATSQQPSLIPAEVLFTDDSSNKQGVKVEYFTDKSLSDLAYESTSPELALVCSSEGSLVSNKKPLQLQMCSSAVEKLISVNYLSRDDIPELYWFTRTMANRISIRDAEDLLHAISGNPKAMKGLHARDVYELIKSYEHLSEFDFQNLIKSWCSLESDVVTELGAHPAWTWVPNGGSYNLANYSGFLELGKIIAEKEALAEFQSVLENGEVLNLRVANLLSVAHRYKGTHKNWLKDLDSYISKKAGELKIPWLFARSYAEEFSVKGDPNPSLGISHLQRALLIAQSEQLKFRAFGELAARYSAAGYFERTATLIEEYKAQFTEESKLSVIDRWKFLNQNLWERSLVLREEAKIGSVEKHIAELVRRLAKSTEAGKTAQIERIKRQLDSARQHLSNLRVDLKD